MKKIEFPQIKSPMYIANFGFMSQWCCDCGNRHIWHFKIIDGKYIEITMFQDNKGNELRKHYKKNNQT